MGRFKKIINSKTRLSVMIFDAVGIALLFTIYMLFDYNYRFPVSLITVGIQTVLCILFMIIIGSYDSVDIGITTLFRCSVALVFGSVVSFTVAALFFEIPVRKFAGYMIPMLLTIILMYIIRGMYLYYAQEYKKAIERSMRKAALIVGAGAAARILLREMDGDSSPYYAKCLVDDDARKIGIKVHGVEVAGPVCDIPKLVEKYDIDTIIVAIPSLKATRMSEITEICVSTKADVKTLPSLSKIIETGGEFLNSIKNIRMEDLLGRDPVKVDNTKVSQMVKGKICMVTGGGGSIGSELCRQIMLYSPARLIIVDIYENNAYEIQQELRQKYGADLPLSVEIASVRDYDKMEVLFDRYRPELVFHAAAHKHVPLMEYSAEETVKNNVFGTYNTALLAIKYKASRFLLISTDKAVNPTNVMGASKRCCELLIKYFSNQESETAFITVRFGNVLGSNGSVVPLFEKQIEKGGPVTITHPEICRYFMTIPEAVSLVLQAETMAQSGQIFVLNMGKPIKIVTMAENLIRMYGYEPYKDIEIKFTGLREGEKLYEELRLDEEQILPTYNSQIFIGSHIDIRGDFKEQLLKLKEYADANDAKAVIEQYKLLVPTFQPSSNK